MKKIILSFLIVSAIALSVALTSFGNAQAQGSSKKFEQWEYRIIAAQKDTRPSFIGYDYSDQEYVNIMNSLGAEGWEFVSVIIPQGQSVPFFYFKRRLP